MWLYDKKVLLYGIKVVTLSHKSSKGVTLWHKKDVTVNKSPYDIKKVLLYSEKCYSMT